MKSKSREKQGKSSEIQRKTGFEHLFSFCFNEQVLLFYISDLNLIINKKGPPPQDAPSF